ncbi:hypothetical protein, partial [Superficieibacter electus]|uniref:hypothetical protein n=1 Tax=Superficieibacter electus TaxID=2022662 RepID=UPI001C40426F
VCVNFVYFCGGVKRFYFVFFNIIFLYFVLLFSAKKTPLIAVFSWPFLPIFWPPVWGGARALLFFFELTV